MEQNKKGRMGNSTKPDIGNNYVGYFIMSGPEQLLIENILLKLSVKAKLITSGPGQSTAMQIADIFNVLPPLAAIFLLVAVYV